MAHCTNGTIFPIESILFPEKIPNNLNNCPIPISTTLYPPFIQKPLDIDLIKFKDGDVAKLTAGIEIEIFITIGALLNIKPSFRYHKDQDLGQIFENGSGTGVLGALLSKTSYIGIGNIKPNNLFTVKFEFSNYYSQVSIELKKKKQQH